MNQIPELKQDFKRLLGTEYAGLYQHWRLRWVENELVLAAFEGVGPESWVWECDLQPS